VSGHDRYLPGLFVARWGFAVMVAIAVVAGLAAAATVTPPSDLPSVALRATAVNRGVTELGTGGVRAGDLAAFSEDVTAESESRELLAELIAEVDEVKARQRGGEVVN
jgi:hypothetical protein